MKKLERNIPGVYDFDEVLDYLHRGIMDMRTNVVWNLIQMGYGDPGGPVGRPAGWRPLRLPGV